MNQSTVLPGVAVRSPIGNNLTPWVRLIPGLALSAALAVAATQAGRIGWLAAHGLTTPTLAIVLGFLLGNTFYARIAAVTGPGVGFSKQTLLRAGIVLYGLRLTLGDFGTVGLAGVLIDAIVLTSTFGLAYLLGTRLLGLDRVSSMLIGAGSAICGAAAVMATEPVVKGKAEQVTVAVASVVVFGTLAIFLYPALYALNGHWGLPSGQSAFGVYAGSTIHEVAQVFAAGRAISAEAANTAVITKMGRVMMLAPFLLVLSAWMGRRSRDPGAREGESRGKVTIPWFAFGFVAVVLFNSLALLPAPVVDTAVSIDTLLLAMAMAALGLTTHVSAIRRVGFRPFLLASMLFAWLIVGGAAINRIVSLAFH